jgi:hypothetical protein
MRLRPCGLLAVVVLVLSTGTSQAQVLQQVSQQVSQRFLGTFVVPPEKQGEPSSCGRENNDGAMTISARSIALFEHQCDVTSFRLLKTDPRSAEARLSCTGEGNKWKTRAIWNLQQVESRTILVTTRLQVADIQLDGKRLPGKMRDDVRVTVYVRCPAAQPQ